MMICQAFRARLKDGFRRFLTGDLGPGLGTKGAELLPVDGLVTIQVEEEGAHIMA